MGISGSHTDAKPLVWPTICVGCGTTENLETVPYHFERKFHDEEYKRVGVKRYQTKHTYYHVQAGGSLEICPECAAYAKKEQKREVLSIILTAIVSAVLLYAIYIYLDEVYMPLSMTGPTFFAIGGFLGWAITASKIVDYWRKPITDSYFGAAPTEGFSSIRFLVRNSAFRDAFKAANPGVEIKHNPKHRMAMASGNDVPTWAFGFGFLLILLGLGLWGYVPTLIYIGYGAVAILILSWLLKVLFRSLQRNIGHWPGKETNEE